MNIEHATPELFAALAAAQAEVKNADKNAQNPHYRSRYAELAEAICENDALRAMKYLRQLVAERLTKRAERDYDEHNGRRR